MESDIINTKGANLMKRNKLKITFSAVFYLIYLSTVACNVYIIKSCIEGDMSYYYGSLIFLPIFIVSFWMNMIFEKIAISSNNVPDIISCILLKISDTISLLLLVFWIIVYFKFPNAGSIS